MLKRNGYHLKNMLKKRQPLKNDDVGKTSSSITSISYHGSNNAAQEAAARDQELEEKTTTTWGCLDLYKDNVTI